MQGDCSLRLEGNSSAGRDGGNPVVWQVDRLTSCAKVGLKEGQEKPISTLLPHPCRQPHGNTTYSVQSGNQI